MSDGYGSVTRRKQDVEDGVRYGKGYLTGNYYRVTDWDDRGGGRIVANSKEPVDRDEVPDHWLEVLDDE